MGVSVRKGMMLDIHQPIAIVRNVSGVLSPVRMYTDADARLSIVVAKSAMTENETTWRTVLRFIPSGKILFNRARIIAGDTIEATPIPITELRWMSGDCNVTSTEKTGFRNARGSAHQPNRMTAARYSPAGG